MGRIVGGSLAFALGLSAPRFFVIKMEDEVTVDVTISGTP